MTLADSRIDELRRRLERDPGSRLFAQLAEEHRKAGEHAEAIRVARAGLVQHPSYPSARLTLGRALLDSGDAAAARVELEAALRDAPDNILASRFLGHALEALGELGPALVQLEKTLKMAPGDRQLQSQIVSLQTRLRSPQGLSGAPPGGGTPPAPMPVRAVPSARPMAPAPPEADDQEGVPLPPTIPIHKQGERVQRAPAPPVPPPLPPTAAPSAGTVTFAPPPLPPRVVPAAAAATTTGITLPVIPPELSADPFYESDVAPTLPTASSPDSDQGEVTPTAPTLPPGGLAAEETVFETEAPPEPAEIVRTLPHPASAPDDAGTGQGATPFSSSTLAELYFRQGLVDRAVGVYRQVLEEEPGNDRARSRLAELEKAPPPAAERVARRAALERTIEGLEALLVVLQRR